MDAENLTAPYQKEAAEKEMAKALQDLYMKSPLRRAL
jgi:hypothetical protein